MLRLVAHLAANLWLQARFAKEEEQFRKKEEQLRVKDHDLPYPAMTCPSCWILSSSHGSVVQDLHLQNQLVKFNKFLQDNEVRSLPLSDVPKRWGKYQGIKVAESTQRIYDYP